VPIETAQLDWQAPFNLLVVRAKGRPASSINLEESKHRCIQTTHRDASLFEHVEIAERQEAAGLFKSGLLTPSTALLPSTVPPATTYIVSSLTYIEQNGNSYEPGTEEPRASARALRITPEADFPTYKWDQIERRIEEEEIVARRLN
jgi:hypothetical protein